MRLSAAVKKLRSHVQKSQLEFGKELGVSHTAIVYWEAGKGIGPFRRMKLLEYAKRVEAPAEIVAAFEAAAPEITA